MIDVHGITPFWVAVEHYADRDTRIVDRSWFVEDDPPYRKGRGIRIRMRNVALHVGVMRHTRARTHEEALAQRAVNAPPGDVEDIADWRSPEPSSPRSSP